MASSQKLNDELTNGLSVKMEEHNHFKPNIQLINNKQSGNTGVFSVLSNHPNESETHATFNPPSLFSNNVRHTNDNLSSTNIEGRIGGSHQSNSSNLAFPTMSGRSQEHSNQTSGHISGAFSSGSTQQSSQTHHAPPPTIFSAALNSANLLSSGANDPNQITGHASNQEKEMESNQGSTTYSHSIAMAANNLNISSIPTTSSNSQQSQQYSQSSGNVHQLTFSQTSTNVQYAQPSNAIYQSAGATMVPVDSTQVSNNQQPTYVLLQAPNDTDSNGQPQVFLAMQTTGIAGQDSQHQPYITLQPVSVDGSELSNNTIVQEGVNLQQAVMHSSNSSDIASDDKTISSENGQQVVLSIPGQQSLLSSSGNNGSLVTYLQPLSNIGVPVSNMEQSQVIMASSDLQGNLTIHNVAGITGNRKNVLTATRQSSQGSMSTPRRRLSTDPRSCEQCGRTFKYPSDLKKHLQIHTDVKKFACEDCNRAFRRLHQLNVHRRIHTGEKPYVCTRCNAQFRHDSTLTMHIRTRHDHLKPFTCDGCSKKFGRMSHLRKHQRNVCGRSSIRGAMAQCKYCDAIFPKKSDLKAHFPLCEKKPERVEKELASPPTYECETCGKMFTRIYDYKRHQLSHSDEKPYGCPQCGKMFKERSSLNKHVKRMHCSEGDGTIPIEDDGIIAGDDDDEDEDEELSVDDQDSVLSISNNIVSSSAVKAAVFSQSGIITNSVNQVVTANGQTISATEILNFPEVAEALGINSGAHATVLGSDGNSTMIAITEPGNLETTEVSMDIEQNIIQDGAIIVTDTNDSTSEQYIPTHEQLGQITSVQVDSDPIDSTGEEIPVIFNPENTETVVFSTSTGITPSLASTMVFKRDNTTAETFVIKREDDVADHVKAEQAAAHDLQPEDEQNHVLLEE